MRSYNPADWYWLSSDGRLFSSSRVALIEESDPVFLDWRACGGAPTVWPADDAGEQTDAALHAVLAPHGLAVDLAGLKGILKAEIDDEAERLRLSLITPGSGQAMEYQETQRQAEAALAGTDADATAVAYPMLAATIGIDVDPSTGKPATDIKGVARSIHAAWSLWLTVGAQIRSDRLSAKVAIDAATTIAAARAARKSVI